MSILRKCDPYISNFKSARSLLSTLIVRAAKALHRPSSLKLGGIGIKILSRISVKILSRISVTGFLLVGSRWCLSVVKILSRISVSGIFLVSVVCLSVCSAVVNGSLDLAARAIVLQAFLFDEAKFVAA